MESNNNSNINNKYHHLYNLKLFDEDIIEGKIDEYYSFIESSIIDFENYLSNEIENIYLKMLLLNYLSLCLMNI